MIVKNERHVIERCLASVKPVISHWVIVDTGSTDGTQDAIREYLRDIPGELIERPWVDFAHNRSEALGYAAGKADYLITIDADEVLTFAEGFEWPELIEDGYKIETRFGGLSYRRIQILKNTGDWYYKGVLHEHIASTTPKSIGVLPKVVNLPSRDGARSADPNKFKRDALTLEKALLEEPENSRYVFYLAQSYRDAGEYDAALKHYQRRAQMQGDPEEVWCSLYQAALMQILLGESREKVLHALLEAYAYGPDRAEPLYKIAAYYRELRSYPLAQLFIQPARNIPYPEGAIFVEKAVYDYLIPFEHAICCYWSGQHAEAIRVNNQILATPSVAPEIFDQAIKNRRYSLEALYPKRTAAPSKTNRFKVCIPFRNPGTAFDNCIDSLLGQDYGEAEFIFFDNASTDGSLQLAPTGDSRVRRIRSQEELPRLQIIHALITQYCHPDDIVLIIDGSDWLADWQVFSKLNRLYNSHDCWVLYGQYSEANGRYGRALPYPDEAALRDPDQGAFPHLIQTFRAGLYHQIRVQDPEYRCLKDSHGQWHEISRENDSALMLPLLQQAGFDKVRFNDEVMYILNTDGEENKR